MKVYAVDWGYKEGKTVFFDGVKATSKEPVFASGDIIATENMPHHKKVEFHHKGVKVLTCSTNMTAERRRQLNLELRSIKNASKKLSDPGPGKRRWWVF